MADVKRAKISLRLFEWLKKNLGFYVYWYCVRPHQDDKKSYCWLVNRPRGVGQMSVPFLLNTLKHRVTQISRQRYIPKLHKRWRFTSHTSAKTEVESRPQPILSNSSPLTSNHCTEQASSFTLHCTPTQYFTSG